MRADELVLGIDGGGTKTVAWLSPRMGGDAPIGCGIAGPADPQAIGFDKTREHLERAVDEAFASARVKRGPVSAACAAIPGMSREADRRQVERWAGERRLARRFVITHEAQPILSAGTPQGWGVALVAGIGSFAYGRNVKGRSARVGGWGPLIGDEGSGYALGVAGLKAVARAEDGRGKLTKLTSALLSQLSLAGPADLVAVLNASAADRARALDRARILELAPTVLDVAAEGDEAAAGIVREAADQLAGLVQVLVIKLSLSPLAFPLAITGSALLHGTVLSERLVENLAARGLTPEPMTPAPDPVAGAVKIARAEAQA